MDDNTFYSIRYYKKTQFQLTFSKDRVTFAALNEFYLD